ncbi:hypothetical protein GH714_032088 [Hevea brasiliensis]|uniref:Uncharacterized protein n=1 Tax=Hevea brasiliensis TaxID=3981 RepID=A0A6A6N8P4_HEVBR|nr:hypothetical protein GH714_032088 [Hevea brasiliensis]
MQALSLRNNHGNIRHQQGGNSVTDYEGLDKVLVKHVSRLEKEKIEFSLNREDQKMKTKGRNVHMQMNEEGGLDQILVKHKSKLEWEKEKMELSLKREDEKMKTKGRNTHMQMMKKVGLTKYWLNINQDEREKMAFSQQPEDQIRFSVSRREARERDCKKELYRNNIGGKIPKELGKLKNLVSMDLYDNKFEGEIPKSLAKLKSLRFLDVSNNDLCGTIPVDGPFATFPMESFEHNRLNGPELKGLVPYDFGC